MPDKFILHSNYKPTGDQPEAYIASSDTYIEKDSSINDEIERLRHSATAALSERRDVIIVASVSCNFSQTKNSHKTIIIYSHLIFSLCNLDSRKES